MAIKGVAPMVPVAISGTRDALRKGSFVIRPVTVRVTFGAPVETAGMTLEHRDTLAAAVRGKVEALLAET
jgi:1-acyl-sn-glycerol-3-phosphate acyltransferase